MQAAIWTPSHQKFIGAVIEPCSKKLRGNAHPPMKANETGVEERLPSGPFDERHQNVDAVGRAHLFQQFMG